MAANPVLPLVTFEDDHIHFHDDVAKLSFANSDYSNLQVHLVSVMGPSRTGKSFLMSCLTRESSTRIQGAFQAGYDRYTEGVLIYMKPLILDISGQKRAVFFVDTQGVFDTQTNPAISGWIAGFSLLISDVQILNLSKNIGADDLQEIRRFTEFAAMFPEQQLAKSLIFLLRDSPHDVSGKDFIQNVWDKCSRSGDLAEICSMIRARFADIGCVLSPAASNELSNASGTYELTGKDGGILDAFDELATLFRHELAVNGRARRLSLEYCERAAAFLEHEAPQISTSVEVMSEARVQLEARRALEAYECALGLAKSSATLPAIAAEAERKGRFGISNLDASDESRREVSRLFASGVKTALDEVRHRFSIADAENKQREQLQAVVKAARAEIQKLTSLEAVLAFEKTSGVRALLERLLGPQASPHILELALPDVATTFSSHYSYKLTPHFEDFEYELNAKLRSTLETMDFDETPTKQRLLEEQRPFLRQIEKELERVAHVLPVEDDFRRQLLQKAEANFGNTVDAVCPFVVAKVERAKQLAEQRAVAQQEYEKLEREAQMHRQAVDSKRKLETAERRANPEKRADSVSQRPAAPLQLCSRATLAMPYLEYDKQEEKKRAQQEQERLLKMMEQRQAQRNKEHQIWKENQAMKQRLGEERKKKEKAAFEQQIRQIEADTRKVQEERDRLQEEYEETRRRVEKEKRKMEEKQRQSRIQKEILQREREEEERKALEEKRNLPSPRSFVQSPEQEAPPCLLDIKIKLEESLEEHCKTYPNDITMMSFCFIEAARSRLTDVLCAKGTEGSELEQSRKVEHSEAKMLIWSIATSVFASRTGTPLFLASANQPPEKISPMPFVELCQFEKDFLGKIVYPQYSESKHIEEFIHNWRCTISDKHLGDLSCNKNELQLALTLMVREALTHVAPEKPIPEAVKNPKLQKNFVTNMFSQAKKKLLFLSDFE